MRQLEAFSKRAAIVALLAITTLQLALHPDTTWPLRIVGLSAFALGWFSGGRSAGAVFLAWLVAAPVAPALLYQLTGREGPVSDVLWMAGLAGSVVRAIPWGQWSFPAPWKPLLGGWALVLALSWPVLIAREADLDVQTLRGITAVNSWAMLTAIEVVSWTLYAVQGQLLGLLWFDWIHRAFDTAPRLPRAVHALWIGVTLASIVALVQGTVDIAFLNTEFWIERQRAAGTMLDANAYGFAAAVAGPIGYLALRGDRRMPAIAAIAVLTVNWSGLWMSGSRTTLLCALFGAAGLTIGVTQARQDRRIVAVALAAAAAVVLVAASLTVSPVQRAFDVLRNPAELWSRESYGPIATQMIREYPLTGVGVAAYRYLAPDYERAAADRQLALDNAQNWWRHQLSELGVLGGMLILLWSALVAMQALTAPAHSAAPAIAWTIRALVVGIGAVSMFGMPTQNPVALLWFFLLVAWMDHLLPAIGRGVRPLWIRAAWIVAAITAAGYVAGHTILASGPLGVTARAVRFHREYVQGAYAPEPREGGGNFRWTDDEARFVLPARTPWLVVRLWAHHPDIAEQPVEVTLSADCGIVFSRALDSATPIAIGVLLPPGSGTMDMTVRVSRTWRPADAGAEDTRVLGVAVATDFVDQPELVYSQDYAAEWKCPSG